ncbi:MAG: hypothetical protein RL660_2458 [Bacteroidota bacterium]|jgi:hypothetical protein
MIIKRTLPYICAMASTKNAKLYLILVILTAILSIVKVLQTMRVNKDAAQSRMERHPAAQQQEKSASKFETRESDINRNPQKIIYTKHAKCRMGCRHLDESEVREILAQGRINYNKSNDRPGDCPTYALEGRTHDGQQCRMVFAFCNSNEAKVITVIDLDTDWKCDCE